MKVFTDLHIHSALSPCSDKSMTPNNIVNMAVLKELDVIAITDHNSAENAGAVMKCAEGKNLKVIPGMELEAREEVHLVCFFPDLEAALNMQDIVYNSLPDLKNREEIFGAQIIMDEQDEIVGNNQRLLLTALDLSIEDIFQCVEKFGGVTIPAHVDRQSYSIISNLGTIPENLGIRSIEVSRTFDYKEFSKNYPGISDYRLVRSSDAHSLGDILEREHFLELDEISVREVISRLKHG